MATIRPMRAEDIQNVEYVCRMTAGEQSVKDEKVGNITAKMFSTYYVRDCCDSCFVLADESDRAGGYILCEPDYRRFRKNFRKTDVPQIYKSDRTSGIKSWFFPVPYSLLGRKYPAHLHIDLLPEYQNGGYGSKMIQMLLKDLRQKNIKGVMLIAGSRNCGAIRFYKKNGFEMIFNKFGEAVMAMDLTK
ncbi:MAG: GNAT family N-acetyltransferase [Acutalibacteraceae bacterium]